jgi:hypothetical protein
MVRFIEDEKVDLIDSDVTTEKAVVENVGRANNNFVQREELNPSIPLPIVSVI